MNAASVAHAIWFSGDLRARVARALLTPAERVFGAAVRRRNARFDAHPPRRGALPAVSIGNLTVGGTGKSPVSAWFVRRMMAAGGHPAVVLRGHGDDEWREHVLLNPRAPVVVAKDRSAGLVVARMRGADCAVLDDAFQHRHVGRTVDVVLVSADAFTPDVRLIPAGPYREPMSALARADVVVVTVKSAVDGRVDAAIDRCARYLSRERIAVVRLVVHELRLVASLPDDGGVRPSTATTAESLRAIPPRVASSAPGRDAVRRPLSWFVGRDVYLVSGIGDPAAFEAQIAAAGATVTGHRPYADHHAYSAADARQIAASGERAGAIVCTLKDAVKLRGLWPRGAPPLWYVSQTVVVDRGAEVLERAIARVLAARTATALTAG